MLREGTGRTGIVNGHFSTALRKPRRQKAGEAAIHRSTAAALSGKTVRVTQPQVIHLRVLAPAKPKPGAACNGCGVCCAVRPCPIGMLLSAKVRGACTQLHWSQPVKRYECGALNKAKAVPWPLARRILTGLVGRWIGADDGCDSSVEVRH